MRGRGVLRASDLADRLEVSTRTVYRDIAHLQASGLPIEGEAGVGYMLRPGFDLPGMTFTHDQIAALAAGLSFIECTGDPELAVAASEVRAKIQAVLPQNETRVLADAPYLTLRMARRPPPHAGRLREAIRKRLVVQFSYRDLAGKPSHRRVRPLAIWNLADGWMFSGWCELRADFRSFRLDRIDALSLTRDSFADEAEKSLAALMALESCHRH